MGDRLGMEWWQTAAVYILPPLLIAIVVMWWAVRKATTHPDQKLTKRDLRKRNRQ